MNTQPNRRHAILAGAAAGATLLSHPAWSLDRSKDVAWLKEVQQPPSTLPKDAPLLEPIEADSIEAWKRQRADIARWWLDFLGPLDLPERSTPKLEVIEEDKVEGVTRRRVRYEIEPKLFTEAYLLLPAGEGEKRPGVAVFHSTVDHSIRQPAGVEGKPEKAFGLKLAQRGCVTFCPRNYLWPTNDKIVAQGEAAAFHRRHTKAKGMAKMLYDAKVAVDILAAMPEVDADRIGSVGHSLGAKEVLYLAAFDERVKVTVSSEGGVGVRFSNWNAPWYLGETIDRQDFKRDQHELLALAAPRPFLLVGGDSADGDRGWPFIEAALPVYRLYGEPPRLGLFNHKMGHSVPREAEKKIYEWFDAYL